MNLPRTVDEDDSHSILLMVLFVTLRSIYREQEIAYISNHSKDREERRKQFGKHQNQANNSCNIKQFLTVPKLYDQSLGRELRFAKRITQIGVTKLKL